MKTISPFCLRKALFVLILLFALAANLMAQPPYYNYNTNGTNNSFPLGIAGGKNAQWLLLAGDLANPTPAPAGNITKFWFRVGDTYPINATYTTFEIKLGQAAITVLPTGSYYTPMTTVFTRASFPLVAAGGTWVELTLDTPFPYNPAQALIIEMGQCGGTGITGFPMCTTTLTGNRRNWSVAGCPFVYSSASTSTLNCGVTIASANTYYNSSWCPLNTYPPVPSIQLYQACAWLGDTLFLADAGTTGAGSNVIRRYTISGGWTLGVPLPVARTGGTLTSAGGKLYYTGGSSTSVTVGSTNIYEYSAGVWTLKAPMPASLSGHSTVNWGDSVLFVMCGPWASGGTGVYYYRIGSDTWGTSTAFTGSARRSQCAGISGNKIFIAGGFPFTATFFIGTIGANATTITWAAGPNVPVSPGVTGLSRVGGAALENAFYVVGGERGGVTGNSDSVHVWSISGNAWVRSISGAPGGAGSNIFAAVTAKKINDTVKVFLPGYYSGTVATSTFNVVGCGPNIFTGLIPISNEIPNQFSLSQNYPNPFNPITNIKFSIPKAGLVKLVVFDILGREVITLLNEVKPAGNYLVDYDASSLSSGVYFYTLTSGDFTDTKKMMLVK